MPFFATIARASAAASARGSCGAGTHGLGCITTVMTALGGKRWNVFA